MPRCTLTHQSQHLGGGRVGVGDDLVDLITSLVRVGDFRPRPRQIAIAAEPCDSEVRRLDPAGHREVQTDDRLADPSDRPEKITGLDGKTYPATPKQDNHEAETEVGAGEELPRYDFEDDFDDEFDEEDDSPTRRFKGSCSIYNYLEQVAAIGLASDNGIDIDLATPLTGDDPPADLRGIPIWKNLTDAEVARKLADQLRAALPRIEDHLRGEAALPEEQLNRISELLRTSHQAGGNGSDAA